MRLRSPAAENARPNSRVSWKGRANTDVIKPAGKPIDQAVRYPKSSPNAALAEITMDTFVAVNSSMRRITIARCPSALRFERCAATGPQMRALLATSSLSSGTYRQSMDRLCIQSAPDLGRYSLHPTLRRMTTAWRTPADPRGLGRIQRPRSGPMQIKPATNGQLASSGRWPCRLVNGTSYFIGNYHK